jgi:hypothetical protein
MKIKKTLLKIVGGLVLAYFAITVIASEGIVIDELGKPIKGAHVITYWEGTVDLIVEARRRCYHLEATTSDESGKFRVPIYSGTLDPFKTNRYRTSIIFAPGYYTSPLTNRDELKFVLTPITKIGSQSEQFDYQRRESLRAGAGAGCGNDKARLPYLKAVYAELVRLATTKSEKERCDDLMHTIQRHEFSTSVADEKRIERNQSKSKVESQ